MAVLHIYAYYLKKNCTIFIYTSVQNISPKGKYTKNIIYFGNITPEYNSGILVYGVRKRSSPTTLTQQTKGKDQWESNRWPESEAI